MKRTFITMLLGVCICLLGYAQEYQKTALGLTTTLAENTVEIKFYSNEIVRIIKYPKGNQYERESLSVILKPQPVTLKVTDGADALEIASKTLKVQLNKTEGTVRFYKSTGASLLSEKNTGIGFTPVKDNGKDTYAVYQAFNLDADEPIYGLGQHQRGNLNQRNQSYRLEQSNLDDVVPFFQSFKGYGVFWDNYAPTDFTDNAAETSFRSDVGDAIDYYVMYGGNADGVISQMRTLTGKAPLFPLWTYGFWQSKERYKSQYELIDVVKQYRKLGVPLDGIIQDWRYWGNNYLWNAMEFLNPGFPSPDQMVKEVHDLHAHLMISVWSSFGPMTKQYKELAAENMLLNFTTWPESGSEKWPPNPDYPSGVLVYDVYNPKARDIYWKYLNKGLFSLGIDGWWMDSTEPDHLQIKPEDYTNETYLGSFRKVRNAFPLMAVGGVYTHQRAITDDKRVFILTRSAFAGQQRFGANTWSGDTQASWETLRNQIPAGLNFSLSGIPYWNSDIGGFFLHHYRDALHNADYRELYTRWLEFGTFSPMMRSHGTDAPREIYQFGKKGDPIFDTQEKFIKLRYALLPYIYSCAYAITEYNSSMMRALFMDFPEDSKVWDNTEEYMFGKSLLIHPVTRSMYVKANDASNSVADFSKVQSQKTYLPEGTYWYDFWNNEKFEGGQTVERTTPLDIIPVYVKSGTILPIGPDVQYATEKSWDHLTLCVYPGMDGTFTLYEDEFDTYNYEQGAFSTIVFSWDDVHGKLTISKRKGDYQGMLTKRTFSIRLPNGKEKEIVYKGKKVTIKME
ncbi:xylosidase [Neptunitalea chrysea]|uniref:Xylosidase n=1 Tax=Neptunitalea chrysea TaxID=1647581 RepID=A0A9W6B7D9_9FLAO|nr:TIM-barrel domain-containing protein [Neptunitalea chrysea]GLB53891.1 xylosidase [Neptunitalea chrysea]